MIEIKNKIVTPQDVSGAAQSAATDSGVDRRDLLKFGLVGILGAALPVLPTGNAYAARRNNQWSVNIKNSHTGERFNGVYRVGDTYLPEAFDKLNYVLRDYRTDEMFPMDPRVVDIVSLVQRKVGARSVDILSGYRSPKTNAGLRRSTRGVAKNSFHMYGQALDIRAKDVSSRAIREAAKSLRAGGVGYYPKSSFVHVDTGDVRSWTR